MSELLRTEGLSKRFGGVEAVRQVSCSLEEGRMVGIIGPNGAGKTTLFNLLTGVYTPSAGRIFFAGQEISRLRTFERCRLGIARTFQTGRPFGSLSVEDNLLVSINFSRPRERLADAEARRRAGDLLAMGGLEHKHRERADRLSVIERKTLELARAVATSPRLLLLDEVLAGLGPADLGPLVATIRRLRAEMGITVVWIEHLMHVLMDNCDYLLVLNYGELLAQGTPEQVANDPAVVEAYLGKGGAARGHSRP